MAAWRLLAVVLLLSASAATARAQRAPADPEMPIDPKALTFGVSPDHEAPSDSGRHVIKYIVEFRPIQGLGQPRDLDLGRPPAPDGVITVPLAQARLEDGRYMATVRAISQSGSSPGAAVGPFQIGRPRRASNAPAPAKPPAAPPRAAPAPKTPATADAPAKTGDRKKDDEKRRGFWRRVYGAIVG